MGTRVNRLRLRGAVGQSGGQPAGSFDRFSNYVFEPAGTASGVANSTRQGNEGLKPERQNELELGADVELFDGRAGLEATYYDKTVSDLVLPRTVLPSTGFLDQLANVGELRNKGLELLARAVPVQQKGVAWTVTATATTSDPMVTKLSDGGALLHPRQLQHRARGHRRRRRQRTGPLLRHDVRAQRAGADPRPQARRGDDAGAGQRAGGGRLGRRGGDPLHRPAQGDRESQCTRLLVGVERAHPRHALERARAGGRRERPGLLQLRPTPARDAGLRHRRGVCRRDHGQGAARYFQARRSIFEEYVENGALRQAARDRRELPDRPALAAACAASPAPRSPSPAGT